ncbi:MAG TPA: DUF302 domain-containing protein [Lamprocystis sp. (in: g-proteobacteria)]|nr:DUF302 domain-containing protein [Lamprocystis sp. (in: g-proteobacteria)]
MLPLNRLLALTVFALLSALATAGPGYAVYESQASVDDVLGALKLAIEERGMYVNNMMHLSEMLDRTGKDLGQEERIYERAESVEFCSAVLSREMTREDPARLVNCPFIISVYALPGTPGKTYVVHREIPPDQVAATPVMARVATMLKEIAGAAANW